MSKDTKYSPFPFVFQNKGIYSRFTIDRPPGAGYYLNLNSVEEREEQAISSRYGSTIINRDPLGTGTTNYFFPAVPVTITRLVSGSSTWRYVGLAPYSIFQGTLYRRSGDSQGQFTVIDNGTGIPFLSGKPFSSLVTTCYQSAQPYLFIADSSAMLKDSGTGTPVSWGITGPSQVVNTLAYGLGNSTAILIIDSFLITTGYGPSGITLSGITTIGVVNGTGGTAGLNYEHYACGDFSSKLVQDGSIGVSGGSFVVVKFGTAQDTTSFNISDVASNTYAGSDAFTFTSLNGTVPANTTATLGKTFFGGNFTAMKPDDFFVLSILVTAPQTIQEIRLQFDVNSSNFTSSYYYKSISPTVFQSGVSTPQTTSPTDAVTSQVSGQAGGAVGTTSQSPSTVLDVGGKLLFGPPGSFNGTVQRLQPAAMTTGTGSWSVLYLRKGDFLPVGNAGQPGLDWSNISSWQIQIITNTQGSTGVSFNGLYTQSGGGASSYGGVGYDYRYSYFDAVTNTESNPCAAQYFPITSVNPAGISTLIVFRQPIQVTGQYSNNPRVTHVRIYRRGGTLPGPQWLLVDQITNTVGTGTFNYKDIFSDSTISTQPPLNLANDPPVTSTLQNPIVTTLSGGLTPSAPFTAITVTVTNGAAVFLANQIVNIGTPADLEQVIVVTGGTGTFTACVQLPHANGEPVQVFAIPAQPLNLSALAYNQVWLAGDANNPHLLYFSNPGFPENFPPQNYIPVGNPSDPIMAVINFRGTLFVATRSTWYQIYPGVTPVAQPTGSKHGLAASFGWCQTESAIWYQCLPQEAEALTKDGWKSYEDLDTGEEILSYDMKSGECKWEPATKINVYDYDGDLIRWRGGRNGKKFDFSFTPEHKWVWRPEKRRKPYVPPMDEYTGKYPGCYDKCSCGQWKGRKSKWCQSCRTKSLVGEKLRVNAEVHSCGGIVQAAPINTRNSLLSPHEAAILGWLITDGSITRNNGKGGRRSSRIYQVYTSKYVPEIKALTLDCMTSCQDRFVVTPKGETKRELAFLISTEFTEALLTKSGYKTRDDLPSIVCKLDFRSASAMLEAMLHGDGSGKKYKSFTQKSKPIMEAFRILSLICGYPTNEGKTDADGCTRTQVIVVPALDCKTLTKTKRKYKGKVWCPSTRLGTWVTRYKGRISITGNSFDGIREFNGADGAYRSALIEWVFQNQPTSPSPSPIVPLLQTSINQVLMSYWNNRIFIVYPGTDGVNHRLIYDLVYSRWHNDDLYVNAMNYEADTNTLVIARVSTPGAAQGSNYAVCVDQVGDYDDTGWSAGALTKSPVGFTCQTPYYDQGQLNNQKQYNMLTVDANTAGQTLTLKLLFDDNNGSVPSITLPPFTASTRQKFQFILNSGAGQQAYRISAQLTGSVLISPVIYQMEMLAAELAAQLNSFDTYWIKFGTDESKLVKQGYFDYTSDSGSTITVRLFADGDSRAYYTFTLPGNPTRAESPTRVRFPALKLRQFRMIATCTGNMQFWVAPQIDHKPVVSSKGYAKGELVTS